MNRNALILALGLLPTGITTTPTLTVLVDSPRPLTRADFASGKAVVQEIVIRPSGETYVHVVAS